MANQEHLEILRQGVKAWNEWRQTHPDEIPDFRDAALSEANLIGANLSGANLSGANLRKATLYGANLIKSKLITVILQRTDLRKASLTEADLRGAKLNGASLRGAYLIGANLTGANLAGAKLGGANLARANLHMTNLHGADLSEANLSGALLVQANLANANLSGCHIFGISAWKLRLKGAIQPDLVITDDGEPIVTVDNLEVAQFIYLLLNNKNLRDIIDTIGNKAILILGRFTPERKAVLDAIRDELRKKYVPIIFDFAPPTSLDLTETVVTLAHLSRFVIADLSDPNSIPAELMSFVEKLLSVPVQPVFCAVPAHPTEFPMFQHIRRYPQVLPVFKYETKEELIAQLWKKIIEPLEVKVKEVRASI